ncbi:MAG: hypothetical protein R6U65_08905 [Perlabentimonas sp.]
MTYTVFCIYNTPELLQQIEKELVDAPENFTVFKFSDSEGIIETIKKHPPSIILIDANFGIKAALELTQAINLTQKNKQIPVVDNSNKYKIFFFIFRKKFSGPN